MVPATLESLISIRMLKAGEKKEEPKKKEKEKKDKEPKDRVKKVKKVQPAEGAEKKPTEMNEEDIKKKLGEILAARGKRVCKILAILTLCRTLTPTNKFKA